jgi:hypothetical protein
MSYDNTETNTTLRFKAYKKLVQIYRLLVIEMSRAVSERDVNQINNLENQISVLTYLLEGDAYGEET